MAAQPETESIADVAHTGTGNVAAMRFRDFPWFDEAQRTQDIPVPPLMAHAWAEAILRFWEAGIATGSIDPAEPLYLFDPAPREGRLAWLLMRALQQRLAMNESLLKPCYVACGEQREPLDSLAAHPYLAECADDGWFDTALFPAGGNAITLRKQGCSLLRTANPVVVLCLQWFATLPPELYAVHHGKAMVGWVTPSAVPEAPDSCSLDYEWRPLDESDLARSPYRHLLTHCLSRFTSAPLPIPAAAFEAIACFAHLSSSRYLLLSADPGCHAEQQLRLGMLTPPGAWRHDSPLSPVNYHALSLHQQQQGAWTWNRQTRDEGMVLHAAWNTGGDIDGDAFDAIVAPLAEAHPDDAARLAAMAVEEHTPDAASLLALLKLSGYDPSVLMNGMSAILRQAHALCDTARREWQAALSRTWANYLPPASGDSFHFDTGMLAAELGYWELAKVCFQTGLAMYGDDALVLHHLAYCEALTGGTPLAMRMLVHALELDPGHPHCLALRERLAERLRRRENTCWYHPDAASADELTLEPLGPEHAESLFHQYRDAQIGVMTRLPELDTLEETRDWIDEQGRDAGRTSYAVMHRCWGFVGVVSIHCAKDAGYFYFWTGSDFQDRGYGKKAARLLFEQAARNGIVRIFTSAYADNTRSRNALARLGFGEMAVRAQAPDDDLLFFHLQLQGTHQPEPPVLARMIAELCSAIESPMKF